MKLIPLAPCAGEGAVVGKLKRAVQMRVRGHSFTLLFCPLRNKGNRRDTSLITLLLVAQRSGAGTIFCVNLLPNARKAKSGCKQSHFLFLTPHPNF